MSKIRLFVLIALACTVWSQAPVPAQAQTGGVITTNYPKPGDTAAAPISLFPPRYGSYSNMDTDPTAVTTAERDAVIAKAAQAGITFVSLNRWEDAKEGATVIQVINNVPIQGGLYTIALPPGWKKSARLPIVLSGNGATVSNNGRLWQSGDLTLLQVAARGAAPGHSGLIAALSNAGGTESQGVDDHTYQSVGAFFDFMAVNGGDPQKAVTVGGSRGGGTALMWAINPLKLNYTVIAVFADIPPTAYGTLGARSVLTYPNLGGIYQIVSHDPNAYQYANANGPSKVHVAAMIGTDDPAAADAKSPIGLAEGLRGKVVVIARGTHDAFFPLWEFIAFDHRLTELGISHATGITLGQGHIGSTYLAGQATRYLDALTSGQTYTPVPERTVYINLAPPDGPQVALSAFLKDGLNADPKTPAAAMTDLPFAAEIPAGAGVGLPVDLGFCGAVGASYAYSAADAAGKVWTQGQGTFDANECAHSTIKAPDVPGDYAWTFTYSGKPVSSINTPRRNEGGCGLAAVTTVTQAQPTPAELVAGEPTLGFGVDQYSAQESSCIAP